MKTLITLIVFSISSFAIQAQTKPAVKPATKGAPTAKPAVKPAAKPAAKIPSGPVAVRPAPISAMEKKIPGTRVKITTDSGVMIIRLYDKTPLHRDNFVKLVNDHFFDSLLFHRVMNTFMIQGGDPNSKYAQPGQQLGMGDVGYTVQSEFDTALFHKRGALAAARQPDHVNPTKASSGCQFYVVQGKIWSDQELNMFEMQRGYKYSPAQRQLYKTTGGTAQLDMNYTVFGEMESGFEVIDKIASVPRDGANRPFGNVRMRIELIK